MAEYDEDNVTVANPTPSITFDSVFGRLLDTTATLGGNYLTAQGQIAIANAQADAQARINGYSSVNPSLGAVNPNQAFAAANQTLLQRWLPSGSPMPGVPATGAPSLSPTVAQPSNALRWVVVLAVVGLIVYVGMRLFRK